MPLTLVTGPANSAKAGEVLGGLRARLDDDPILVVPAFQDVEHSQRELAAGGAVIGARVVRFAWLFETIAERTGQGGRRASPVQRELLVQEAITGAGLEVLADSAGRPGFTRAAARFLAELERSMVEPARFTRALRDWAGDGPRRGYAEEVARLYRRYRDLLDAAGLVDAELYAWRALDALRREPARWRDTPLFVYGFDDFTPLELEALETIARRCGADVTVSLPFEPGRIAFRVVAPIYQALASLADREVRLEALSDHYSDGSRDALHHLERNLFELEPGPARPAGETVRLHAAGGERAEVELVGADVLRLLREGVSPGDVAVVLRETGRYASLVEQVFGAYGIPFSIDRSVALRMTSLGRGLLALVRAAVLGGGADDLLAYLRTPGRLRQPGLADRLESEVRKQGAESAEAARKIWEDAPWKPEQLRLDELDRLRGAGDMAVFVRELDRALQRLFTAPYRRMAPVLDGSELEDPRTFDAAHDALAQIHALIGAGTLASLDHAALHETLSELRLRLGENPQPDRVQVASPGAIRARRFHSVFVCGLQEEEFPRGSSPEPFLPDSDRTEIAKTSGLALPLREDRLDRERYLFYVCASRAESSLVLSARYCDEEGNPASPSFFVEDVRDLFDGPAERRRSLSEVTWAPEGAPTAEEWARTIALRGPRAAAPEPGPLTDPGVREELAARESVSAAALERFADCPVKWLVDSLLRPEALEPDPEAMVRGRYAHAVLEGTYRRLREATGSRRVTSGNLAQAEQILLEELELRRSEFQLSPKQTRVRAAVRRLQFDLLRFLRHEAESDSQFEPEHLELRFGPIEVAGVNVRGVIDRVDTWDGHALVRDYKSGKSVAAYKADSWERENRFQAALYMLAVEELHGLEPAGGVYVPLGGEDRRARGLVADLPQLGSDFVSNDRREPDEFRQRLEDASARISETAARMARGELRCTPDSCAYDGGCSYPSICRSEG
ncbi:MAG: PD-(D/E)XK nuclease family protein [Thermoleophilaceae bacterium]